MNPQKEVELLTEAANHLYRAIAALDASHRAGGAVC